MMTKTNDFIETVLIAFKREAMKKLVLSRPKSPDSPIKVTGRLCAHRGKRILALEFSLSGNTVSQKNVKEEELSDILSQLIDGYKQANLITARGDVEWKVSKSGKEALLGADALKRKLTGEKQSFESAIEALDRKKNYILTGGEDFLIKLGISDKGGRVHDKKQGKFRQINKFLENIEAIYDKLPCDGEIKIYDLCCGKSYLSFAVYYYLTVKKKRDVSLLGIDLKRDVILWCDGLARELGYKKMNFVCDDVTNTPVGVVPDMVISLHACDIATDIVIDTAIALGAGVVLSTPCCHRYLNSKISAGALKFVSDYSHLSGKLCEAITDALRARRLAANGYTVTVTELTDPENTPKNTLIRAIKTGERDEERLKEYENTLKFILGDGYADYLKEIRK